MNNNLLIIGAGIYGLLAKEIAQSMGCFGKIDFIDDSAAAAFDGTPVKGSFGEIGKFFGEYENIVVAIGNPSVRARFIEEIVQNTSYRLATLISPLAYVAPSAKIMDGCIIEPMAVVHTCCELSRGCIVSAGAVINHAARCEACVHVDCNATVPGYCSLPEGTKVLCGTVYKAD